MSYEYVFRMTEEQQQFISGLLEKSRPGECVCAKYGTGTAKYNSACVRTVFCLKHIESKSVNISTSLELIPQSCIFMRPSDLEQVLSVLPIGAVCVSVDKNAFTAHYQAGDGCIKPMTMSAVVGDKLVFTFANSDDASIDTDFSERMTQAFGKGTTEIMSKLTFGVAGASGTGSLVIEQLVRLGAKRLIIVDDDIVEKRNVGRILNSSMQDAAQKILKVEMLKREYERMGLSTELIVAPTEILDSNTIHLLSGCDVLFGCLDSRDGRQHMNQISTFYCIPYIDVGVRLEAKTGLISEISGSIRYIKPGGSSLRSRGVITLEQIESDALRRSDPEAYQARLNEKYIVNASEGSPAVISVNMFYSSVAVLELLSRIHSFRSEDNSNIESIYVDLLELRFCPPEKLSPPDLYLKKYLGAGDVEPLIGLQGK
jgi:hypothetical protein